MQTLFLLVILSCSLIIGAHGFCSVRISVAPRHDSGGQWDSDGKHYQIFDINAFNNGTETVYAINAFFAVAEVQSAWNYDVHTGVLSIYSLNPGSSWSGAGMIVVGYSAPVLQYDSSVCSNSPSSSPTQNPTQAPTQNPTRAPTSAPPQVPTNNPTQAPSGCQASVVATYDTREPSNLYRLNVTNTGSEVITSVIITFADLSRGYNYDVSSGALTAIYHLFPGQFNTFSGVYWNRASPNGPPPENIQPTSVVPTCKKLTASNCNTAPNATSACSVSVQQVATGPSFTQNNKTSQRYTIVITNNGASPVTSTTIASYLGDYTRQATINPTTVVGLRQYTKDPSTCFSFACSGSFMGQYIVLLPNDYLCSGAQFNASFVVYTDLAQIPYFSTSASNTLCY